MNSILKIFSILLGYNFFKRIQSFKSILISFSLNRRLNEVSGFARFQFPTKAIGLENINIGENFAAGKNLRLQAISEYLSFKYEPRIRIGNNVTINPNCQIVSINEIIIGDNVLLASNVFISDHSHGYNTIVDIHTPPSERKLVSKGAVVIESNVWIGQNVSILPDVRVGHNCIIGSNSVVTKDIPDFTIAAGCPAVIIKRIITDSI